LRTEALVLGYFWRKLTNQFGAHTQFTGNLKLMNSSVKKKKNNRKKSVDDYIFNHSNY
jgi:hypothetical protein